MASAAPQLAPGQLVFYQHPENSWVVGSVEQYVEPSGRVKVAQYKVRDQQSPKDTATVADTAVFPVHDSAILNEDVDDLLHLPVLHDATLLHTLRKRYFNDVVYTYIGPIVIAINPFNYTIPWYRDEFMPNYLVEGPVIQKNKPHSWAVAHNTYHEMVTEGCNSTILVSGESGAGKTEAVKIVLKYLRGMQLKAAASSAERVAELSAICDRILLASPVLEAFGNAKTVRNDNSSRFGKFLRIQFVGDQCVIGGSTAVPYLLEKSRVVACGSGERVFHSFYQLLRSSIASSLGLASLESYPTVTKGGSTTNGDMDDVAGLDVSYNQTVFALGMCHFSEAEIAAVWRVTAAVLHLCRAKFIAANSSNDAASIEESSLAFVDNAARLLCVPSVALKQELLSTTTTMRGETYTVEHSLQRAEIVRQSLCQYLYSGLFLWVFEKINLSTRVSTADDDVRWIGLLDIFGFEDFQTNSFEQLAINLANETLQNHYNEYIFERDMDECRAEGIDVNLIDFKDNGPTCELMCGKGTGIFSLLDEECAVGKGSDLQFLDKIVAAHSNHPSFHKNPTWQTLFAVRHYAGVVQYEVTGFLDKNRDSLKENLKILFQKDCTCPIVSHLLPAPTASDSKGTRPVTVSGYFINQIRDLMSLIRTTTPHWIRCIKPHKRKAPRMFSGTQTMTQMISAGVLETVRIRSAGYPVRLKHLSFVHRFACLARVKGITGPLGPSQILSVIGYASDKGQVGKTKVFLKSPAYNELETLKRDVLQHQAITVQCFVRCRAMQFIQRAKFMEVNKELIAFLKRQFAEVKALQATETTERSDVESAWSSELNHLYDMFSAAGSAVVAMEKEMHRIRSAFTALSTSEESVRTAILQEENSEWSSYALLHIAGRDAVLERERARYTAFLSSIEAVEAEERDKRSDISAAYFGEFRSILEDHGNELAAINRFLGRCNRERSLVTESEESNRCTILDEEDRVRRQIGNSADVGRAAVAHLVRTRLRIQALLEEECTHRGMHAQEEAEERNRIRGHMQANLTLFQVAAELRAERNAAVAQAALLPSKESDVAGFRHSNSASLPITRNVSIICPSSSCKPGTDIGLTLLDNVKQELAASQAPQPIVKAVVLQGPRGSGKTLLSRQIISSFGLSTSEAVKRTALSLPPLLQTRFSASVDPPPPDQYGVLPRINAAFDIIHSLVSASIPYSSDSTRCGLVWNLLFARNETNNYPEIAGANLSMFAFDEARLLLGELGKAGLPRQGDAGSGIFPDEQAYRIFYAFVYGCSEHERNLYGLAGETSDPRFDAPPTASDRILSASTDPWITRDSPRTGRASFGQCPLSTIADRWESGPSPVDTIASPRALATPPWAISTLDPNKASAALSASLTGPSILRLPGEASRGFGASLSGYNGLQTSAEVSRGLGASLTGYNGLETVSSFNGAQTIGSPRDPPMRTPRAGAAGVGALVSHTTMQDSRLLGAENSARIAMATQNRLHGDAVKLHRFRLLVEGGIVNMARAEATTMWRSLRAAFDVLKISGGEFVSMTRTLTAVLHLSELQFDADYVKLPSSLQELSPVPSAVSLASRPGVKKVVGCRVSPSSEFHLAHAASALGVPVEELRHVFLHKDISIRNMTHAATARAQALAASLYKALLRWMVRRINLSLQPHGNFGSVVAHIRIFDGPSPEDHTYNGLTQALWNVSSDALRGLFNHSVFDAERERSEKLHLPTDHIKYHDVRQAVQLYLDSPQSIFSLLQSEQAVDDEAFRSLVMLNCANLPLYRDVPPPFRGFALVHAFGIVPYSVGVPVSLLAAHDLAPLASVVTSADFAGQAISCPSWTGLAKPSSVPLDVRAVIHASSEPFIASLIPTLRNDTSLVGEFVADVAAVRTLISEAMQRQEPLVEIEVDDMKIGHILGSVPLKFTFHDRISPPSATFVMCIDKQMEANGEGSPGRASYVQRDPLSSADAHVRCCAGFGIMDAAYVSARRLCYSCPVDSFSNTFRVLQPVNSFAFGRVESRARDILRVCKATSCPPAFNAFVDDDRVWLSRAALDHLNELLQRTLWKQAACVQSFCRSRLSEYSALVHHRKVTYYNLTRMVRFWLKTTREYRAACHAWQRDIQLKAARYLQSITTAEASIRHDLLEYENRTFQDLMTMGASGVVEFFARSLEQIQADEAFEREMILEVIDPTFDTILPSFISGRNACLLPGVTWAEEIMRLSKYGSVFSAERDGRMKLEREWADELTDPRGPLYRLYSFLQEQVAAIRECGLLKLREAGERISMENADIESLRLKEVEIAGYLFQQWRIGSPSVPGAVDIIEEERSAFAQLCAFEAAEHEARAVYCDNLSWLLYEERVGRYEVELAEWCARSGNVDVLRAATIEKCRIFDLRTSELGRFYDVFSERRAIIAAADRHTADVAEIYFNELIQRDAITDAERQNWIALGREMLTDAMNIDSAWARAEFEGAEREYRVDILQDEAMEWHELLGVIAPLAEDLAVSASRALTKHKRRLARIERLEALRQTELEAIAQRTRLAKEDDRAVWAALLSNKNAPQTPNPDPQAKNVKFPHKAPVRGHMTPVDTGHLDAIRRLASDSGSRCARLPVLFHQPLYSLSPSRIYPHMAESSSEHPPYIKVGRGELPYLELKFGAAEAHVYLQGAHVTYWRTASGEEPLFMSSKANFAPSKPIRGGIPVCFPQFADRGPLQQHGYARTSTFTVGHLTFPPNQSASPCGARLHLDATEAFNAAAVIEVELSENSLNVVLEVLPSSSSDRLSFTVALHTYLKADIASAIVHGLSAPMPYHNSLPANPPESTDGADGAIGPLRCETDRIYPKVAHPLRLVPRAGKAGSVAITATPSLPDVVLWNPWIEKAARLADLGDEDYKDFVCVESAAILPPATVEAGSTWRGGVSLVVSS